MSSSNRLGRREGSQLGGEAELGSQRGVGGRGFLAGVLEKLKDDFGYLLSLTRRVENRGHRLVVYKELLAKARVQAAQLQQLIGLEEHYLRLELAGSGVGGGVDEDVEGQWSDVAGDVARVKIGD